MGVMPTESVARAQALCRAGEIERARAIAGDILKDDPTHSGALQLVEDMAFNSGDFADAIDRFSAAEGQQSGLGRIRNLIANEGYPATPLSRVRFRLFSPNTGLPPASHSGRILAALITDSHFASSSLIR
jgi:hypothetical protein